MATVTRGSLEKLEELLGADAQDVVEHKCNTVPKEQLHLPGPDFVDRIWKDSDRPTRVLGSLQAILGHGRLANTGYVSILPVDQGIEHTAGASFAPNPIYFDGAKIVELALEDGCNAVGSTFGLPGAVARKYEPTSSAWPRSSGATCATTRSRRTASITRRPPTSPARPTTLASRSRRTSSNRSCLTRTAASRSSGSARPHRASTTS